MGDQFKVIIIGSGLSGTLLANGLIRNNVEVTVYERLTKGIKREGYQIRIGPDSLRGFQACLDDGQVREVLGKCGRSNGSRSSAPVMYDKNFNVLLDATKFPTYNKSAPINRVILRDILAKPVEDAGCVLSGKQFERYSILNPGTTSERVRAHFSDGSWDDCDLLIGADGSHSKINRQVGLNNISELGTHLFMISKCELPTERYRTMSSPLQNYPLLTFADNMSMFYCAYLPDKENEETLNEGARSFDDKLSSCMFALIVPVDKCPPDFSQLPVEEQWDFIAATLRSWAPEYHEIVDLLRGSSIYAYKTRASKRPSMSWRKKVQRSGAVEQGHPRVWLLGDAMHAMLPARGMGGNTAMRDTETMLPLVTELAEYAEEHKSLPSTVIAEKLAQYEAEMIPRAFEWVEKSGGTTIMPLDSTRFLSRVFFFVAAQAMNLSYLWKKFTSIFTKAKPVQTDVDFERYLGR
ncbi:hypothetical protein PV08_04101 [Exophiala spinifera]|uniref:FAD-binding domain-containing protein n=1 Tax=Exophiala spinifera TaxID=91928 RepID=A0A0D1YP29_9EURO|nr:uncharacterized protein PV08_04101 [Exophiala spinifera]KIW16911.1 hypothetical protein PV08_04101 [Exophiala spinifera]